MALYSISYDLLNNKTFGEYEDLINELRRLGAQKALYSDWVLRNTATSVCVGSAGNGEKALSVSE